MPLIHSDRTQDNSSTINEEGLLASQTDIMHFFVPACDAAGHSVNVEGPRYSMFVVGLRHIPAHLFNHQQPLSKCLAASTTPGWSIIADNSNEDDDQHAKA